MGVRVFVVIRNSEFHNLNPDFPIERTPSSDYRFIKWGQDFSWCVISWFCGNRERVRYHMVNKQPRVCVHRYHMIMRQRRTWKVSWRQVCSVRASSPPGVSCERHVRGDALSRGWLARQSTFARQKQWLPFSIFSPVPRDTQQETSFSNMFTAIIIFIWDLE